MKAASNLPAGTTADLARFHEVPECYIDSGEALEQFLGKSRGPEALAACAIDTEADSMHSYETKLCLIQFAAAGELAVIDPLAIDPSSLIEFTRFIDRFDEVWMHGADYDISLFSMTFDWVPQRIFDTQIAARFLGAEKFGLANLLEAEYGLKVSKQSQKADWSRRPLSEKMLAYAYDDVRYLLDMAERYKERLRDSGRYEWFVETCEAARNSVLTRDERSGDDRWRITGWGKLSAEALHYLRCLWEWRDDECRRLDRPAFKFLGNQILIQLAEQFAAEGKADPPHYIRPRSVERMRKALAKARACPKSEYPSKRVQQGGIRLDIDERRFEELRDLRDRAAASLGIAPTLIATRGVLEKLAAENVSPSEKCDSLLKWQRDLLGPSCF